VAHREKTAPGRSGSLTPTTGQIGDHPVQLFGSFPPSKKPPADGLGPDWRKTAQPVIIQAMIVIRRLVDRQRAYTAIFLPGEEPRIFPTTEHEHGRILQIYKQDRPYDGIINDFSEDATRPLSRKRSRKAT
jgi:hypothetical protein